MQKLSTESRYKYYVPMRKVNRIRTTLRKNIFTFHSRKSKTFQQSRMLNMKSTLAITSIKTLLLFRIHGCFDCPIDCSRNLIPFVTTATLKSY